MDKEKRRLLVVTIFLLGIIFATDIATGAIALASGPVIPADTCRASNMECGPISYVTSVSGNNTGQGTVTTGSWGAVQNQSMIVVAAVGLSTASLHTMVSNITDTLGDSFSRKLIQQFAPASPDSNNIEVWFGQAGSTGTNALTAKWNFTDGLGTQILQANVYTGLAGVGATNSTSINSLASSLTLKTAKSGSWIFGAVNIVNPICPPPNIGTSPSFIRRIDTCQAISGIAVNELESSDNATTLRNAFKLSYVPTGSSTAQDYAEVELIPVDSEPLTPDFATQICSVTATPCIYANAVNLATGTNALNQILVLNQVYCTGITTAALTTTGHPVILFGGYAATSLNQTGAKLLVQFKMGTSAPTTSFASGTCGTGTVRATASIYFAISGSVSATTTFSTAIDGVCTAISCGSATYYGWFEITPQNFVGHINYDQIVNQVYGLSSIGMIEER